MSNLVAFPRRRLRIALARAHQMLGWPGWGGVVLTAFALLILGRGWMLAVESTVADESGNVDAKRAVEVRAPVSSTATAATVVLPRHDQIPQLLADRASCGEPGSRLASR
jgi:hypothetical protein